MLTFQRLGYTGIMNARIPVKDGVEVSVSYSDTSSSYFVGSRNDYQCAILLKDAGKEDLVWFADIHDNVFNNCDEYAISKLVKRAASVKLVSHIFVYDIGEKQTKPDWHLRFLCAEGADFENKLAYAKRIWKDKYRVESV